MSVGAQGSTGHETTNTWEKLFSSMTGRNRQNSNTRSEGQTSSTETQQAPAWARAGSKSAFQTDTRDEGMGRDFLTGLLAAPYSGEGNRFSDAIDHMFSGQLAKARTGNASNTGVARQGFREGEALAGARRDSVTQGMQAAMGILGDTDPMQHLLFAQSNAPRTTTGTSFATEIADILSHMSQTTRANNKAGSKSKGKTSTYGAST